ncbi:MAG: type II toxin-antitoxin system PemK/MazF family toxin [Nocardioides sp.]|uniref:type II toxin-antitoxin system PemK/MazF family toxin n=1 Tax=Nocardioides sp. TaxID=35761 RepID=UPI0039E31EA3
MSLLRTLRARLAALGSTPTAGSTVPPHPTVDWGERVGSQDDTPVVEYDPHPDGRPDPGEVVWAWVAYEDDPSQGKDRPVLLLAEQGGDWCALMLTSKDHDRDAADEARWGRYWMDVGSGAWDSQGRPSEVRLDRLLRLPESAIRREGAALDRAIFDQVLAEARTFHELA